MSPRDHNRERGHLFTITDGYTRAKYGVGCIEWYDRYLHHLKVARTIALWLEWLEWAGVMVTEEPVKSGLPGAGGVPRT